jgi:hypothetical protein
VRLIEAYREFALHMTRVLAGELAFSERDAFTFAAS